MAYVPGFDHDIFISYASVNNPEPEKDEMGWVTNFRVRLEKDLACRIGKNFKIWMDQKDIAVGDDFRDEIIGGVETSAILLIILSEVYLDSEWCTTERNAFMEQVGKLKKSDIGGFAGLKRIFVVRFEDVNRNDLPSEFKGLQQIDFFREDENKKVYTLGWPQLLKTDQYYHKYTYTLANLSRDLANCLKELKDLKDRTAAGNTRAPNLTTSENRSFYEKMMKECHGLIVIYGESDERWVTLVVERSVTIARDRPYGAAAIIEGPSGHNKEMLSFLPNFMREIDCTHEFNEKELHSFFSDMQKSFNEYSITNDTINQSPDLGAIVFVNAIGNDRNIAKKIKDIARLYDITFYCPKKKYCESDL